MKTLILLFCVVSLFVSCGSSSSATLPDATQENALTSTTDTQNDVLTPTSNTQSDALTPTANTLTAEEQQASANAALAVNHLGHLSGTFDALSNFEVEATPDPDNTLGPNTFVVGNLYLTFTSSASMTSITFYGTFISDGITYDFGTTTSNPFRVLATNFGADTLLFEFSGLMREYSADAQFVYDMDAHLTIIDTHSDEDIETYSGSIQMTVTPESTTESTIDYLIDFDGDTFSQNIDGDVTTHNIGNIFD